MKTLTYTLSAPLIFAGAAHAQLAEKKNLTLEGARQVIAGAMVFAKANYAPGEPSARQKKPKCGSMAPTVGKALPL
ncbi:MAG TPA: hypothetical protein VIT91_15440 [Chthoniobacterales bacterium]